MDISRASTETVGHDDHISVLYRPNPMESANPEPVPEHLLRDPSVDPAACKRLVVAIDFGTTYSAIAYCALGEGEDSSYLDPSRIRTIQNYPDDATFGNLDDQMRSEVPTEVIYPLDRNFREKWLVANQHGAVEEDGDFAVDESRPFELDDDDDDDDDDPFHPDSGLAIFGNSSSKHDTDAMSTDEENSFRWGYVAHEAWGRSATHVGAAAAGRPLSRFKLLLDDSPRTAAIRADLCRTLNELKAKRILQKPLDVIVDFLVPLLRHAKVELEQAGFDDSWKTEVVLCVPAIWTQKACRDMQGALGKAMALAGFPGVDTENNSIDNLFIVSEPEAAAAYVLTSERDISVRPRTANACVTAEVC